MYFRFTNCLVKVKKNADCVRFEGRQRRSVICASAEMLCSSGYSQWELWDSLISFCASSVTLKSALQEHESSHSDKDSFSDVHTANPAGRRCGGHFSSTQPCSHWVQRSNNSLTLQTQPQQWRVAPASHSHKWLAVIPESSQRLYNFKFFSEMICRRGTRGQVPASLSLCSARCEEFLSG